MSAAVRPAQHRFGLSPTQQQCVVAILETLVERVERVAVFGSRAEGRQRANSDLDLVLYGSASEADCDRLLTLFQDSSLPFSVDVKSYERIDYAPLRAHIDVAAQRWLVREAGRFRVYGEA